MTAEEKAEAERKAREAFRYGARGVISSKSCPYPADTEPAMHWLAWLLWLGAVVR